jgi:hypothetical protein
MKAITAQYYGATNFKGARIRVQADGLPARWYAYAYESSDGGKVDCILDFAERMAWKGELVFGTLPTGETVGVFAHGEKATIR